jgi:uncharacterized protein
MLRQSIPDPANHIAVLRSIAHGHNRNSDIASRTGLTAAHVTKVVTTLERLGLAATLRPVTASPRAKKTAYAVADQFLRFHYRFVESARSQLRTSELAERYLRDTVLPELDHHASISWEQICQQHVLREVAGVTSVGRWWGQVPTGNGPRTEEREIDVVGVDGNGSVAAIGMCKWTNAEVDFDELNLLDRLAHHVEGLTAPVQRYIFSRSGFSGRLVQYATTDPMLRLVTPDDIYR